MNKTQIIAAGIATLAAGISMASIAGHSSPAEFRGYQACLSATEGEFSGLVLQRDYLLSQAEEHQTYYINATAWQHGARAQVGISCDTSRNGRKVLRTTTSNASFAMATASEVRIAGQ